MKRYWMVHAKGHPSIIEFPTFQEAEAQAILLASKHPDVVFGILELINAVCNKTPQEVKH
jgi:hypothetical protein